MCLFWTACVSGILYHVLLRDWHLALSITSSRFFHALAHIRASYGYSVNTAHFVYLRMS